MRVAGLDLSLTGSGVVIVNTESEVVKPYLLRSKPGARQPSPGHRGRKADRGVFPVWERAARVKTLARRIMEVMPVGLDLAVVEAPSFGSKGGHPHERSGLFWLVVTELASWGVPIAEVPPTTRARYATGKGNADKASVVAASLETYEVDFRDDNIVDGLVLAAMGCRWLGEPIEQQQLPTPKLAAMGSVLWPNMKGTK